MREIERGERRCVRKRERRENEIARENRELEREREREKKEDVCVCVCVCVCVLCVLCVCVCVCVCVKEHRESESERERETTGSGTARGGTRAEAPRTTRTRQFPRTRGTPHLIHVCLDKPHNRLCGEMVSMVERAIKRERARERA
jgi:hypothetical protein